MKNEMDREQPSAAPVAARKSKKKKRRERFDYWKLPWLLLLPLGFAWPTICAGHADWIESNYCASFYPLIKDAFSVITSLVPISIAELVLYALIVGVLVELLGNLIACVFRKISGKRMLSVLMNVLILAGVLLNFFYVSWGFNYFREPLSTRMELPVQARSAEELMQLTNALAAEANAVRTDVPEDAKGVMTLSTDLQTMLNGMPEVYERLADTNPVFASRTTRAKRVLWSEGLSWAGIAGVYVGITAEPNVNTKQPPLLLPQGAAHEMAHQIGLASEDEAEFTGTLACLQSYDSAVYYSGVMSALMHCRSALSKVDAEAAKAVLISLSDAVRRDLRDYDDYWDAYNGPVEETVSKTNDAYLKYNAQESGIRSYGECVDLLLAYYDLTNR